MFEKTGKLLYLVADEQVKNPYIDLADIVELAIRGGVDIVQYRNKLDSYDDFVAKARIIRDICQKYSVPFIINDNLEVALAVQADGLHIGQGDMPLPEVRRRFSGILGYSVKTPDQAILGQKNGADYLGAGTVFSTASKADAGYAIGTEGLSSVVEVSTVPVFAIGGINLSNVAEVVATGVKGVAVISAITLQDNPFLAARDLKHAMNMDFK